MALKTEKYQKLFFAEADEKITILNKTLLGLEKKPGDVRLANEAMRASHTLKSSAAAMSYLEMSHLAHAMEDLFELVRSGKRKMAPGIIDILFKSVDSLALTLKEIQKGENELDTSSLREKLHSFLPKKAIKGLKEPSGAALARKPEEFRPIEAIRVDTEILDNLMNLTEELLVEKMKLDEIVKQAQSPHLKSTNQSLNRLMTDLQYNVMQARMLPLGQIFERFPRMIRDLAKEEHKTINFQIKGQEIELDRTVIDRIGEPLIHLLRNAVDHGIEKQGKISLKAFQERGKVIIEVENSGQPIDWEKIKIAAKNKKIAGSMDEILYHPQLSTTEKVTETSGRGIGLYIVKSSIESLGGSVEVQSPIPETNEGTRFILKIPLTLAIIQALLVKVANQTFALPFSQIDRSIRVSNQNIKKALDQEVAVVDEEDIPIIRLDNLFGIKKERTGVFLTEKELEKPKNQLKAELMVIAKKENSPTSALVIDELIAEQDIVVKPLTGALRQTKGFAGITILGNGKPALILDVATLI